MNDMWRGPPIYSYKLRDEKLQKKAYLCLAQHGLDDTTFALTISISMVGHVMNGAHIATHSFLSALTSSHIFFRSAPLGFLLFAPFPFPDRMASVSSSSFLTSFANAACRNGQPRSGQLNCHRGTSSVLEAWTSNVELRIFS